MASSNVPDSVAYNIACLKYQRYAFDSYRHCYLNILLDIDAQCRKDGWVTKQMVKMREKNCTMLTYYYKGFLTLDKTIKKAERLRDVWVRCFDEAAKEEAAKEKAEEEEEKAAKEKAEEEETEEEEA